ncbi:MAG: hypothetical protein AAGI88_20415 [Pseudomonadota bacterium]
MCAQIPAAFRSVTATGLIQTFTACVFSFAIYAEAGPIVFSDADGDIGDTVIDFQAALGDPNNVNAAGPLPIGRRQINWDAGIVPFDMPPDFFNNPAFPPTRGAVFSSDAGSEFRVSNDGLDNEFDTFNPDNPNQFSTFSAPRLFAPIGTTVFDVSFFVPASGTAAAVSGFGAIFTDVDIFGSTFMEFFDADDRLLATETVETSPGGLSFLGVVFDSALPQLARVSITAGNVDIGSGAADNPDSGVDLVAIDDLLYGEPQALRVDAPAGAALLAAGFALIATRRRPRL